MKTNFDLLKEELERMDKIYENIDENSKDINDKSTVEALNFIKTITNKEIPEDVSVNLLNSLKSRIVRQYAIKNMGFALVTKRFARDLAKYIGDNKCLEIMAGQGCLSKALKDEGVDIITTDNYSWSTHFNMSDTWTDVENIDCLDAIKKYGKDVSYIVCSWIPYNRSIGYEALKLMNDINPDCKMIVIGEDYGGCTADDSFFENLEEIHVNSEFKNSFRSWQSIYDYVSIVKFKNN